MYDWDSLSSYQESGKLFNDQIHGYIRMDDLCMSVIDTPQFQRLRDLKQLGTLYYVFPGATHNRFEHSLGVGHLAGEMISRFKQQQPELGLTQREVTLLRLSGLVHDIGHGPFSHVFDNEFIPRVRPSSTYNHEEMSLKMLDYLVDENNIDIDASDLNFVKELVLGAKSDQRSDKRHYLYEVVANGKNCIDVDKFDYLARDTQNLFGQTGGFDFSRLWTFNRVIDNHICYHTSVTFDIYNMFHQRYQLHKQIYTHRKGKAVEYMICDAMIAADNELKISESTEDAESFMYMTDHIVKVIECSKNDSLREARDIIRRIRKRDLYAFVDEYLVPPHLASMIPTITPEQISTYNCLPSVQLRPEDIIVHDGQLNYNKKDRNPVDDVSFYNSSNINACFHTPKEEVSLLFPEKFQERILRVYCRSQDPTKQQAVMTAFRRFLRTFTVNLPPPSPSSKVVPTHEVPNGSTSSSTASRQLFKESNGRLETIEEGSRKRRKNI